MMDWWSGEVADWWIGELNGSTDLIESVNPR
jgi:hypothetical protein